MICSVCGEPLPEPAPTGQRLVRKCKRHYVERGTVVLVMHKTGAPRGVCEVYSATVTAVNGQNFNYKINNSVNDPFYTGLRRYADEGTSWSRTTDDESYGALRAAWNLREPALLDTTEAVEDLASGGYYRPR